MQLRDFYTSREVRAILGVSQRHLDYWDEKGFVKPSRRDERVELLRSTGARGRGPQRLYSFDDLIKLKVLKELRATGLSLQKINKGLKKLRKRSPASEPLDEVLLTDGKSFQRVRSDGKIEDLLRNGQLVFGVMSLYSMEMQVRNKIRRLPRAQSMVATRETRRA